MRIGSLFSGAGMLDVGAQAVLGGEVAWHCEYEPPTEKRPNPSQAAARVLAHHWPGVPNLGDITAVDWSAVEPVDALTAGYPCQPFSDAGKQQGEDDARYLWPEVARAIGALGPRLVVLENVRGHIRRGFARVVGELADLGYDARWTVVPASVVGAPHRRERLFVVAADATRDGRDEGRTEPARLVGGPDAAERGAAAADADSDGLGGRAERDREPAQAEPVESQRPDAARRLLDWGAYGPAVRRWEHASGRPAPNPTEPNRNGRPRLNPAFVEWMMGWPAGWVTDVPGITRNDMLRICGNGVVPQQAAYALELLLAADVRAVA